jgi:small conductance mechanosensitive channel
MERQKRAQTVSGIIERFSGVVVALVTGLMVLAELGLNTTPILTGLGVVGVALGLGAQQLVGDLIAGFFHIFENQIRVGDVATINGTSGLVQELRLRTTVLRGIDGTVYVFRNGTIQTLANMTKDFSYFAMDLTVPFQEDTDVVTRILREIGAELQGDPQLKPFILEPVEVLGIDRFTDTAAILQMRMKTLPSKQWDVGREFRRRLRYRLEKEQIGLTNPLAILPNAPGSSPGKPASGQ